MRRLALLAAFLALAGCKKDKPAALEEDPAKKIVETLTAQCDKEKKLESCRALGVLYADGTGVTADPARARELFTRACEGGVTKACNNLGLLYASGIGVEPDPPRAAALYQRACDGNDPLACRNLGLMLLDGRGVTADPARAATLFEKGCSLGA